jgi:hypothetical protein
MAADREVSLTSNQRSELSSIAQSRTLPAGYVFRAKLILMLAEGASFNTIKRRLQTGSAALSVLPKGIPMGHPNCTRIKSDPITRRSSLARPRSHSSTGSVPASVR